LAGDLTGCSGDAYSASSCTLRAFAERRVPAFLFAAMSQVICIRKKFGNVRGSRQAGLKRIV
jgi:hypothetical protein